MGLSVASVWPSMACAAALPLPQPTPPMSAVLLDKRGKPLSLDVFRGMPILINFWATWCEPCIREIPSMLALAKQMRRSEFVMFAVSYDDSWDPVLSFFEQYTGGIPPELLLLWSPQPRKLPQAHVQARKDTESP